MTQHKDESADRCEVTQAFQEGQRAYWSVNIAAPVSPYIPGLQLDAAWLRGWKNAASEDVYPLQVAHK